MRQHSSVSNSWQAVRQQQTPSMPARNQNTIRIGATAVMTTQARLTVKTVEGRMRRRTVQLLANNAYTATSEITGPGYASWRRKTRDQSQRQSTPLTKQKKKMSRLSTLTPSPVGRIAGHCLRQYDDKYREPDPFQTLHWSRSQCHPSITLHQAEKKPPLRPSISKLFSYSGKQLTVKGSIILDCSYEGHICTGIFHIVDTASDSQPIQACLQLKVIKMVLSVDSNTSMTRVSVVKDYSQLFTGLAELKGEVIIYLKEGATPVVHPASRVPHTIRSKLKKGLDKMEDTGDIEKVTIPTDWINSLVVVENSNGKLSICLDPGDLNAAIKRPHYPMPTLGDALSKLAGARFFNNLDARSGYWQLKPTDQSSYLTTFNRPFGRYRFSRLPFGVVSAQDDFKRKVDEVFEGILES